MAPTRFHPRFSEPKLVEALADSPVVLVHGPRQCGKTTLTQLVGGRLGYAYVTFDDEVEFEAAEVDPVGFVADLPERVILDEVQRVPGLFTALKVAVDRARTSGRFLLTGSCNVLLVPTLADSLAGRMEILRLDPLAQCEIQGAPAPILERLFTADFKTRKFQRLGDELVDRIVAGGFPAALARRSARRRSVWYRDYIETQVQRDVRTLKRIRSLDVLPRLLTVAAGQTAQPFNLSDLSTPFQLSRPTITDYVTLLQRVFLLEVLPAWHTNRLKRLVKTSKLHIVDTGVACALLDVDPSKFRRDRRALGHMLETFVYQELKRLASWAERSTRFYHFRDRSGVEVDIVIERGAHELVGVEVKASSTVRSSDFAGLRKLSDAAGKRFVSGAVFYDGESLVSFGDGLFAVPIRTLWEND